MSYPIRLSGQLKQHLRALRKRHGLTQAQLGALAGVRQARMAEIEADPGAVSLEQITKILAALGATLHLHPADEDMPAERRSTVSKPATQTALRPKVGTAARPAPRTSRVIRPHKGAW